MLPKREDLQGHLGTTAEEHADGSQRREQEFEHVPIIDHGRDAAGDDPAPQQRNLLTYEQMRVLATHRL